MRKFRFNLSLFVAMNLLEVEQLSIRFKQGGSFIEAVSDLSFSLKEAEVLGIVGESGSGKTVTAMSFVKLLSSNAIYHSGKVKFTETDNATIDLLSLSEDELRKYRGAKISIIFQEPMSSLNPVLTCGYQVAEALLTHRICSKKDIKEKVCYWFNKVGIEDSDRVYTSYPHQLSGGQLQRVLIALALCCNPKLVVADEPTTALDVQIQKKILDLLIQLKKELGLTIIFISHDLGVIKYICDRVLVMNKGIKVEENSVKAIFENPIQAYTKGLINSRPPLLFKLRKLPTVVDFVDGKNNKNWFADENKIFNSEQDRSSQLILDTPKVVSVQDLNIIYTQKRNWFGKPTQQLQALKNISFDIHKGEVVGLIGESGSGKSSLGKAILGLTPIDSGKVFYGNIELTSLSESNWRPLRKELQIIFQDPYSSLNPRKTIGSAITEPMLVHRIFISAAERKEKAIELLELVGMEADHFERYPHQFSGGQRQRICIARALSLNAKFIVCDECVSALDVSIQAQVLNLLMELKQKFNLSLLFITHDMSVVQFMADRIIVLNKGEIVEQGKPYEIIQQAKTSYTQKLIESIIV